MDPDAVAVLVIVIGMVLAFGLMGVLVTVVFIGSQQRGRSLSPRPPPPLPVGPSTPVTFQGRLVAPGHASLDPYPFGAEYGTVTISEANLHWAPNRGEGWVVALTSVQVGPPGFDVNLNLNGSGWWRLSVSYHHPLTGFLFRSSAAWREREAAKTFAGILLARGASPTEASPGAGDAR